MPLDINIALKKLSLIADQLPFNQIIGLQLDDISSEKISMSFKMKKELIGNFIHQILHGGVISSVLDMVGGMAAMRSIILKNQHAEEIELSEILGKTSTIHININYVRPGKGHTFTATAIVTHSGNKICFTTMELHNDTNKLIASGSATYLIS